MGFVVAVKALLRWWGCPVPELSRQHVYPPWACVQEGDVGPPQTRTVTVNTLPSEVSFRTSTLGLCPEFRVSGLESG